MRREKEAKRYMIGLGVSFLILAVIRHVSHFLESGHTRPCYFYMISQIGCILLVSCWLLTVQGRIIHSGIRKLMMGMGGMFLVYHLMQMIKYCLFTENMNVSRYMWYGYYIPMTFIPLFLLYIIRSLSVPWEKDVGATWKLLVIPAVLICLGFMTNDLHQLAFGIPNWSDNGRTLGPIYFLYLAFMAVVFILAVCCTVRISRNIRNKKTLLYPAVPLLIGILYLIVYTVKNEWITINGQELLEIAEIFAFMVIGFTESCIQTGLIPSNMGYRKLFALTDISARVSDINGKTVFETHGSKNDSEEFDERCTVCAPVTGGSFFYDVDIGALNRLNRELDETTANIETRNVLLQHENEIAEERKKSEAAIRIYDRISEIVSPQVLEIQKLLSLAGDEERFRKDLSRVAVLNTYIKRRSNMELEAEGDGMLPFAELVTAVTESLEYIRLSGTETFLSASGEGRCRAELIRTAYHDFEKVAEAVLGKTEYMTVRLEWKDDVLYIRFLLTSRLGLANFSGLEFEDCRVSFTTEENDAELALCFSEGGDGR